MRVGAKKTGHWIATGQFFKKNTRSKCNSRYFFRFFSKMFGLKNLGLLLEIRSLVGIGSSGRLKGRFPPILVQNAWWGSELWPKNKKTTKQATTIKVWAYGKSYIKIWILRGGYRGRPPFPAPVPPPLRSRFLYRIFHIHFLKNCPVVIQWPEKKFLLNPDLQLIPHPCYWSYPSKKQK